MHHHENSAVLMLDRHSGTDTRRNVAAQPRHQLELSPHSNTYSHNGWRDSAGLSIDSIMYASDSARGYCHEPSTQCTGAPSAKYSGPLSMINEITMFKEDAYESLSTNPNQWSSFYYLLCLL